MSFKSLPSSLIDASKDVMDVSKEEYYSLLEKYTRMGLERFGVKRELQLCESDRRALHAWIQVQLSETYNSQNFYESHMPGDDILYTDDGEMKKDLGEEVAGWIASYQGKKLEIVKDRDAKDLYTAKMFAIQKLKVPKSKQGYLAIKPAYNESVQEEMTAQDVVKSELEKMGKSLDELTPEEKKELFNKVDDLVKAKNEIAENFKSGDKVVYKSHKTQEEFVGIVQNQKGAQTYSVKLNRTGKTVDARVSELRLGTSLKNENYAKGEWIVYDGKKKKILRKTKSPEEAKKIIKMLDRLGKYSDLGMISVDHPNAKSFLKTLKEEDISEVLDLTKGTEEEAIKIAIDDFLKSDAPQFKGKTKEEKIDMAIAAVKQARGTSIKEEVEADDVATNGAVAVGDAMTADPVHADIVKDSFPAEGRFEYRLLLQYATGGDVFMGAPYEGTHLYPPMSLPGANSISELKSLVEAMPFFNNVVERVLDRHLSDEMEKELESDEDAV